MNKYIIVFTAVFGLLCTVLLFRIQSYVTPQDPSLIYIPHAWKLIDSGWDLRAILGEMAPGWPVILALVLKLFGPYAPYWLNAVFLVGFYAVLLRILRTELDSDGQALGLTACSAALALGAHALNPHFLLYPFRDISSMFFVLVGYTLMWRGERRASLIAAGCCLGVAMCIREVAIVGVAGFLVIAWKRKWDRCLWAFVPLVMGLWMAGMVLAAGEAGQMERYLHKAFGQHAARPGFGHVMENFAMFARSFYAQVGVLGLALLAAGTWLVRKHGPLVLLGLTGLGYLVAYGLYAWHLRYQLTVMLWLAPVLVYPLLVAVDRLRKKHSGQVLTTLGGVALVIVVLRASAWDVPVTREEVRHGRKTIERLVPENCAVVIDPACRTMRSLVDCFRPRRLLPAADFSPRRPRMYIIDALDPSARHPNSVHQFATPLRERYAQEYDVLPVKDGNFEFSGMPYRVLRVALREHHEVVDRVKLPSGKDALLWMDLREMRRYDARLKRVGQATVMRWSRENNPWEHKTIQVLHVPGDKIKAGLHTLTLESDYPLPSNFVFARTGIDDMFEFDFQLDRRLSTRDWFQGDFRVFDPWFQFHVGLPRGTGTLILPVPPDLPGIKRIYVDMLWQGRPRYEGQARLRVLLGAETVADKIIDTRQMHHQLRFEMPAEWASGVSLQLSGVDNPQYLLYLERLKFKYIYE